MVCDGTYDPYVTTHWVSPLGRQRYQITLPWQSIYPVKSVTSLIVCPTTVLHWTLPFRSPHGTWPPGSFSEKLLHFNLTPDLLLWLVRSGRHSTPYPKVRLPCRSRLRESVLLRTVTGFLSFRSYRPRLPCPPSTVLPVDLYVRPQLVYAPVNRTQVVTRKGGGGGGHQN